MRRREGGVGRKGLGEGYREGGDNQREREEGDGNRDSEREAAEEEDVRNPAFMLHKQLTFRKEENLKE